MHTVLLVDDQREILRALRRSLCQRMEDWDVLIASSGDEALNVLESTPIDIVVTDIKMPFMNGAEFLGVVAENYPATLRFVLSGYTETDLVYRTVGSAHQFLSKPVDTTYLIRTLERAICLRNQYLSPELQSIVNGVRSLPSMSDNYNELMQALQSPSTSLAEVGVIVQKDVALTARVMQVVNSSFFGSAVYVSDPPHAVSLLGTEVMKGLVASSFVFELFEETPSKSFNIHEFEQHSMAVGFLAKHIAENVTDSQMIVDDAFIAGLLHDIGKLVLAFRLPEEYDRIVADPIGENVNSNSKTSPLHTKLGAYLLGVWGFRYNIVEAVTYQKTPAESNDEDFTAATAVYIANELVESTICNNNEQESMDLDEQYLGQLDLLQHLDRWKSLCAESLDTQIGQEI